MVETAQRKAELVAKIATSRQGIATGLSGLREDLDIGKRLRHSFEEKKSLWLTGAAISGWLIARLPSRRRKQQPPALLPPPHSAATHQVSKQTKSGLLLALLSFAVTILKPAITRFATDYVSQWAKDIGQLPPKR